LKVKSIEVQNMESRLTGGDLFLNQKFDNESENDMMSLLADDREKIIIKMRKLKEKSITLDELGQMLKISKERVRQIETKALEKLKKAILDISQQNKEFFI